MDRSDWVPFGWNEFFENRLADIPVWFRASGGL
jgi:hypothetical protein